MATFFVIWPIAMKHTDNSSATKFDTNKVQTSREYLYRFWLVTFDPKFFRASSSFFQTVVELYNVNVTKWSGLSSEIMRLKTQMECAGGACPTTLVANHCSWRLLWSREYYQIQYCKHNVDIPNNDVETINMMSFYNCVIMHGQPRHSKTREQVRMYLFVLLLDLFDLSQCHARDCHAASKYSNIAHVVGFLIK